MARTATGEPRVRLNLELTEKVRDRLERLRSETEADSLTEVIRRSLSLYDTLITASRNGSRVVIRDADGERSLLIV